MIFLSLCFQFSCYIALMHIQWMVSCVCLEYVWIYILRLLLFLKRHVGVTGNITVPYGANVQLVMLWIKTPLGATSFTVPVLGCGTCCMLSVSVWSTFRDVNLSTVLSVVEQNSTALSGLCREHSFPWPVEFEQSHEVGFFRRNCPICQNTLQSKCVCFGSLVHITRLKVTD